MKRLGSVVLVIGLLCAGCAGDSPEAGGEPEPAATEAETETVVTKSEFIDQAEDICVTAARGITANQQQMRVDTPQKEKVRLETETLRLVEDRLDQLEQLEVPPDLDNDFNRYLEARRANLRALEERLAAIEAKDEKAAEKLGEKSRSFEPRFNEIGREIGFSACANRLSASEGREVKENLVEYFSTMSSGVCAKLSTDRLIDAFGSPSECAAAVTPSEKVKVRDLEGIDGVRAKGTVTLSAYEGQDVAVELVFSGGTYKVDAYQGE